MYNRYYRERHRGGRGLRPRGRVPLRPEGQPRTAARSSATWSCCPSTGGKAPTPTGKKRDITQPTLEPPLGSAAYKIDSFKPGAEIVWERVPDYWGAKLPVKIGRENFDKRRYTYFQDDNAAWQAFTKGGLRGHPRRKQLARAGRPTTISRPFKAGDVIKKEFQATCRAPHAGLRPQPAPAAVPGPARARGADLRLRFRDHEPHAVLRPQHAHQQLSSRAATWPRAACRRARNWKSSSRIGTSCRRSCSRRSSSCRSTTRRRPSGQSCSRPSTCSAEAGWVIKDGKMVNAQDRRAVPHRDPRRRPDRRGDRRRPTSTCCARSASTPRCASSIQPIHQPRQQFRLRHGHRRASASRSRPATSSAISGARRPPTRRARAT